MPRRFSISRIAFWLGLVLVGYIFVLLLGQGSKSYQLHNQADQLQSQIDQLKSDTQVLSYQIAYYMTDLYKERIARQELNLQAPGESVVIVRRPLLTTPTSLQISQPTPTVHKSNFQSWLDFLFGS